MKKNIFLLLIIMLYGSSSYASIPSLEQCRYLFDEEDTDDSDVRKILKSLPENGAVRICKGKNGKSAYFVASPITSKYGVYFFSLDRIFKVVNSNGIDWDFTPGKNEVEFSSSEMYMKQGPDSNNQQDDKGFIPVYGVSVGLFKIINEEWKKIVSSEGEFKNSIRDFSNMQKMYSGLTSLNNALYGEEKINSVPEIRSVEFVQDGGEGSPHYSMRVSSESESWFVDFDITNGEMNIGKITLY